MRPIKPINDPTKNKPSGSMFVDFLTGTKEIIDNSLTCFADKEISGFQKLALYRSTLKCVAETAKHQLEELDATLTIEEKLKFDATEQAYANNN